MVPADNKRSVFIRSSLILNLVLVTFLFGGAQAQETLQEDGMPNKVYLPLIAGMSAGTPATEPEGVQEIQPVPSPIPFASPSPPATNVGGDGAEIIDEQFAEVEVDEQPQVEDQPMIGGGNGVRTIDDLFAEVARQVPNFGGMFFDGSGQLTMYLAESQPDEQKTAEAAMAETATAKAAIITILGDDTRITEASEIHVLPGQYGFLQLKEWHDPMNIDMLGVPGVLLTDIDEGNNRLRIGIENQEVQGAVEERLAQFGIPREAVIIEVTEPFQFAATLSEKQRPVVGGLQILYSTRGCTLGFIATRSGVKGMVTNSHCTDVQGGVEGTVYYQGIKPLFGTTDRIGIETVDPPYFTSGCPAGRRCRYSDAAFAKIPHPSGPSVRISQGFIARTTGINNNDITIDAANPKFRLIREETRPLMGQILNKVGRTTGWTQGPVSETCVYLNVDKSDISFFCQDVVSAHSDLGDSGSPVFAFTSSPSKFPVNVSATTGWQQTPLTLQQGNQFIIAYTNQSSIWTVDFRNFPYVGPEGYSPGIDQQIWQGCKFHSSLPYARLLGRVGSGPVFSVERGSVFTAGGSGALYLRINDQDVCLGDNAGSVSMAVSGLAQSTNDVSLYGILWGATNTKFAFSPMNNIQNPGELGALKTCASTFKC